MQRTSKRIAFAAIASVFALSQAAHAQPAVVLRPGFVFDGIEAPRAGWAVLVSGDTIADVGPADRIGRPAGARVIDLPGLTLMPGLIEGHSHLLLHPRGLLANQSSM